MIKRVPAANGSSGKLPPPSWGSGWSRASSAGATSSEQSRFPLTEKARSSAASLVCVGNKRRDRMKTCKSKRRYTTSSEADAMARHRREESGQVDLDIYPCPFCLGWHVGHARGSKQR